MPCLPVVPPVYTLCAGKYGSICISSVAHLCSPVPRDSCATTRPSGAPEPCAAPRLRCHEYTQCISVRSRARRRMTRVNGIDSYSLLHVAARAACALRDTNPCLVLCMWLGFVLISRVEQGARTTGLISVLGASSGHSETASAHLVRHD